MSFALEFVGRKIIASVILPPVGPLILVVIGAALARRMPRTGRALFLGGVTSTIFLAFPAIADWAQAPFEWLYPPLHDAASVSGRWKVPPQAIVILGGGRELGAIEYGGQTVSLRTLERIRYGARLARSTGLPILVTGGSPDGIGRPEAELMSETLKNDFAIQAKWTERQAIDTQENAAYSIAILHQAGVESILLVTDVVHMRRAVFDFKSRGLTVIAAPTGFRAEADHTLFDWLPSAQAYARSAYVLHEWVGTAWAYLRNRPYFSRESAT